MTVSAQRLSNTLDVSRSTAIRLLALWVAATAVVIAVAIVRGGLLQAVIAGTGLLVLLVSFRWPAIPLFAFAFLIPIEELLAFGAFGTLSRYAGLLFIVAYGLPRLGRLPLRVMPAAGWGIVGWACLSMVWALDPSATVSELATLVPLFLISVMIAIIVVERPRIVRPLLWTYTASAALTAAVGIGIYLAGGSSGDERVAALPGQDPAHYAALLLPAFAFCIVELVERRSMVLSGLVAALCFVGVIVSGTRGAWLSIVAIVALFVVPRLTRAQQAMGTVILMIALLVGLQLPAVAALVERAESAVSSGGAGRTDIWTVGVTIIKTAPVVGVGYGNFPTGYTPEAVRASDVGEYAATNQALVDLGLRTSAARNAHSIVVGTLGELGVIGLALLLWFLAPLLVGTGWGPTARGVQAALVGLMISALFLDVLNRKQIWLIIGVACGLAYLAHADRRLARATRRQATSGVSATSLPAGPVPQPDPA